MPVALLQSSVLPLLGRTSPSRLLPFTVSSLRMIIPEPEVERCEERVLGDEQVGRKELLAEQVRGQCRGWYWVFRGVLDIHGTLKGVSGTYSGLEFAHECNAMFCMFISRGIERERRVQLASVHQRTLPTSRVTLAHQAAYRLVAGKYNRKFNTDVIHGDNDARLTDLSVRITDRIDSLSLLQVPERSILEPNGFVDSATSEYTATTKPKYLANANDGYWAVIHWHYAITNTTRAQAWMNRSVLGHGRR